MSINKQELGKRIKNIRLSLGKNMREFGELNGLNATDSVVSKWEKGKTIPSPERLKKLAEIGNISVEELLNGPKRFSDLTVEEKKIITERMKKFREDFRKKDAEFVYNELLRLADNDLKEHEIDFLNSSFKFMNVSDINENLYISYLFTRLKVDKEKKHNSDTIKEIAQEISTDIDKFVIEYLKPGKSDLSELGFDEYE